MEFVTGFRQNKPLRCAFNALTRDIFGFDFESWYRAGFWDDRYVPHAFVEKGRIVSNVSATRFDLIINGQPVRAVQLGTVMTAESHRGRGLGVDLARRVLERYMDSTELFYLFAQRPVWSYYEKQGFTPIPERRYELSTGGLDIRQRPVRKLRLNNPADLDIIRRLTQERMPVSQALGVVRDTSVFLFHCQFMKAETLNYCDELDALVVVERDGATLHIKDVLSPHQLTGEQVLSLVDDQNLAGAEKIVFHFTADYPDLDIEGKPADGPDRMFARGDLNILPAVFKYPITAIT